jgi:DNA-binding transcriptional MerR regulator
MRMKKRQFRIGELAQQLGVEKFVIRFWEKEFQVRTSRSKGGQRFYDHKDLTRFEQIKELLYTRGFTIAGAKQELHKDKPTSSHVQAATHAIEHTDNNTPASLKLSKQIALLQKKLMKLRDLL